MVRMLVEFLIRTTLIATVTGAALWALRIRAASAKHAAWVGVIIAMLALPGWMLWGPKASLPVLPAQAAVIVDIVPAPAVATEMQTPIVTVPAPRSHWNGSETFLGLYLLGAVALLLRLAVGTVRARRLTSASISAPVTVGLVRPRIILPEAACKWPQEQRDAVMAHERAHVRRRDPLFQWLALFNRALFWFHPLAWWLERHLAALAEEACDSAVLEQGHDPREYSLLLLDLARTVQRAGSRLNVVATTMPGAHLPQRIKSIASGALAQRVSRTRLACAVIACSIPAALLASGTLDPARRTLPPLPIRAGEIPVPPILIAQAQAAPDASSPVPAPVEFEVASVRRNPDPNYINSTTPSLKVGGDQYVRFVQVTLRDLIMLAYGVGSGQVRARASSMAVQITLRTVSISMRRCRRALSRSRFL